MKRTVSKKCKKGKSCGSSCVQGSKRCSVKLSPKQSQELNAVSSKIGVVALFEKAKAHGAPRFRTKFEEVRKELREEIGGQIRKPEDVKELKTRLEKAGLLPSSAKEPAKTKEASNPDSPWKKMGDEALKKQLRLLKNEGALGPVVPGGKRDRNIKQIEQELERRGSPQKVAPEAPKTKEKKTGSEIPQEEWDRIVNPKDYDEKLSQVRLRREGDPKYDGWSGSSDPKAIEVGMGSYGSVTRNPNGEFVKRGILSENEAMILKKVGEQDLGPKLIAADLNGKVKVEGEKGPDLDLMTVEHMGLRNGRLAMTRVPGEPMGNSVFYPSEKIASRPAADVYWESMAKLHRIGVAHNDAHPGNLMVDEKTGKARWVDFGLSQDSPKAALAEALGAFVTDREGRTRSVFEKMPSGAAGHYTAGNWQAQEWEVTGVSLAMGTRSPSDERKFKKESPVLATLWENNTSVRRFLSDKYGFSPDEISALYSHGIRSPIETFSQGAWKKLSDSDAKELIEVFYQGI